MRFLGIDQSLTGTGIAVVDGGQFATLDLIKTKKMGYARLDEIVSRCLEIALTADVVALEAPALSMRKSASTGALFGLFGVLTLELWRHGREPVVVNSMHRAMYATGKGNAKKDQVLAAVIRRYDDDRLVDNNVADAAVIASMVARLMGEPVVMEGELGEQYTDVLKRLTTPGSLDLYVPDTILEDRAWAAVGARKGVDSPTLAALKALDGASTEYAHALLDYAEERGYTVYQNQGYRTCTRRLDQATHSCGAKKCTTEWVAPEAWEHTVLLRSTGGDSWAILSQDTSEHGLVAPIGGGRRAHLHTTADDLASVA